MLAMQASPASHAIPEPRRLGKNSHVQVARARLRGRLQVSDVSCRGQEEPCQATGFPRNACFNMLFVREVWLRKVKGHPSAKPRFVLSKQAFRAGFEDATTHAHPGQGGNSDFLACGCAVTPSTSNEQPSDRECRSHPQ